MAFWKSGTPMMRKVQAQIDAEFAAELEAEAS
jgi:hypothetical protein